MKRLHAHVVEVPVERAEHQSRIPHHVLQEILTRFDYWRKRGKGLQESYELIGNEVGRSAKVIGVTINRLRPTAQAARLYLQSRAFRMARKVVREADAGQLIDLLSRPSMGVIDPIKKAEGGEGGFFLSVTADTCGAVKIGLATSPPALPPTPDSTFNPYKEPDENTSQGLDEGTRVCGRSKSTQAAIAAAKERLAAARGVRHQENDSIWLADAGAEDGEEAGRPSPVMITSGRKL